MLRPASRQMSTRRVASGTPVLPQAEKSSPLPPKVPVPRVRTGTINPEPPSCLYSIRAKSMTDLPTFKLCIGSADVILVLFLVLGSTLHHEWAKHLDNMNGGNPIFRTSQK